MSDVQDETTEDEGDDASFGAEVGKWIGIGLPVGIVFMVGAVWLIEGSSFSQAVTTAILPGVLFGVFAGGFIGTVRGMRRMH